MRKTFCSSLLSVLLVWPIALPAAETADQSDSESPLTHEQREHWRTVLANEDYARIVKAYAHYMIEHGRDVYGKVHSPLFMTVLNRKTGVPFRAPYPHVIAKPYAPGLRRDHKMRPQDRTYEGSNPLQDLPLYGLLYRLSEVTGQKHYADEADASIAWFLDHAQAGSGLFPWGSHMYYHVEKDQGVYSAGGYGGHEYNYVWPHWEQNPEALKRFAYGIWNHHVKNHETGHFNRHSRGGSGGMEFPGTGACFMDIWAREYGRSGDPQMKAALETLLKLFRSMRDPDTGAMAWCTAAGADRREVANVPMNLFMATKLQDAAAFVEPRDPELAEDMRKFVRFMDDEYLSNDYDKILDVGGKGILTWYTLADRVCMAKGLAPPPGGADTSVGFPLTTPDGSPAASLSYLTPWFPGRSYAGFSLLLRDRFERCEEEHKPTYRRGFAGYRRDLHDHRAGGAVRPIPGQRCRRGRAPAVLPQTDRKRRLPAPGRSDDAAGAPPVLRRHLAVAEDEQLRRLVRVEPEERIVGCHPAADARALARPRGAARGAADAGRRAQRCLARQAERLHDRHALPVWPGEPA